MEQEENEQFEKVIWVKDRTLAVALFYQGITARQGFCSYPDYDVEVLFSDTPEVRSTVKAFRAGKLRVDPNKYMQEMMYSDHSDDMLKEELAIYIHENKWQHRTQ